MAGLKAYLLGGGNRIARRLIVSTVALSSVITLVISLVQLALEYRELRSGVDRTLDSAVMFVPVLSGSVWNFDEPQIRLALDSIKQLPDVQRVSVSTTGTETRWAIGQESSGRAVARIYPLGQLVRGKHTEIGKLEVVASLDGIYRHLAVQAIAIVLSNALKTFLVVLFMFFLVQRLLTSRLQRLARKVGDMGPRLFPLEVGPNPERPMPKQLDELDMVEWTLDSTITELGRAEQHLRLAAVAFDANVGIVIADSHGVIERVNRAFSAMTGYSASEVVGQNLSLLRSGRHAEDSYVALRDSARCTGAWQGEIWRQRKSGEDYPELLTVTAIFNSRNEVTHFVGTAIDISEKKQAEQAYLDLNRDLERRVSERTVELEKAKDRALLADRAKSDFLANMSHELRTPLNAVLGFAQLLAMDSELTHEKQNHAREILLAGKLLLNLVTGILDLSRIESGRMELDMRPIKVNSLTPGSLRLVAASARAAGIALTDEGGEGQQATIQADAIRLQQVLLNLLSNAIKYNRPSGSVKVSYALSADAENRVVRISVTDTGAGIPIEKQSRVFGAFDRLGLEGGKIDGTGIGLLISKRLVEAMGGSIGFSSAVGRGSTFWAEFPVLADCIFESSEANLDGVSGP